MTGIIIARMQVPYLHLGHIWLITETIKQCDNVIILLGCTNQKDVDERNPYPFYQRCDMIVKLFPQVGVHPLFDDPSDIIWSEQVDKKAKRYNNPVLFHSRDSFLSCYKGDLKTIEIPELEGYSGTKLREQLKQKQ